MSAAMSSSELAAAIANVTAQIAALETDKSGLAATLQELYTQRAAGAAAAADRDALAKEIDYWRGKESRCEEERIVLLKKHERLESMQMEQDGT